jgi:hypothetical protein
MAEGIKGLVGRRVSKKFRFMDQDVKINKLTVSEVMQIQDMAKEAEKNENEGFNILKMVIRLSVEDASDLSDGDFDTFPLDELTKLSSEIMKFSGINPEQGK